MNSKIYKGYTYAILSAVIFGCMPLMAKYIYADGVNPMSLVFLRNLLALPSLAIGIIGCCVTPILLFSSYQYIASGTATVFHFIYPSIVVVAGILFLKKKAQLGSIISVIICCVGVAMFYTPGEPLHPLGSFFALFSGVTFATYVLLLSTFKHNVSGFLFTFYLTVIATAFTFIACIVSGNHTLFDVAFSIHVHDSLFRTLHYENRL